MNNAFSLIELIIVLAIIGVLSVVTYPSFNHYLTRAHRSEGQSALINLACRMEAYHMQNNTYQTATIGSNKKTDVEASALTEGGWYVLSIHNATESTYTLKATPSGSQGENDTFCQSLTINQVGVQGISAGPKGKPTGSDEQCW